MGCSAPGPVHLPARGVDGPFSGAVYTGGAVGAGELVFLSAKRACPPEVTDLASEIDQCLDAVALELARMALDLGDLVDTTVYLTGHAAAADGSSTQELDPMTILDGVWRRRIPEPWPARTVVWVAELEGGARVLLQVVAQN